MLSCINERFFIIRELIDNKQVVDSTINDNDTTPPKKKIGKLNTKEKLERNQRKG